MMSDKKIPMCGKCASKVMEQVDNNSQKLIGCLESNSIFNYDDAKVYCPLLRDPNKVLIIINQGVAQLEYKPDGVVVEIRDYDVEGDWDEDNIGCKVDHEDCRYQEMIFPIEDVDLGSEQVIVKLDPIEKDEPIKYINYYRCTDCNTEWQDEWSCQCDDECPICAVAYSPYMSEDINEQKTLTILYHDITYSFVDDSTIDSGDCEYEHIHYMITEGYKEGELNKTDPTDENKTIRGYWRMI
jgi:hypothetical protein